MVVVGPKERIDIYFRNKKVHKEISIIESIYFVLT